MVEQLFQQYSAVEHLRDCWESDQWSEDLSKKDLTGDSRIILGAFAKHNNNNRRRNRHFSTFETTPPASATVRCEDAEDK